MPTTAIITTQSGRSVQEITATIKLHMKNMVGSAIEIGLDLIEMKEACQHGEWLPWLKEIGMSSSTAANYMRVARDVNKDSRMAQLPYTKILALLNAPPEEREELAAAAEDMSAAEIRRLTEERNRAAEAANAETARANSAEEALKKSEREAKEIYDTNAHLRTEIQSLQVKMERVEKDAQKEIRDLSAENIDLRGKLVYAENHKIEVEKIPEDYEQLKRDRKELLEAAASAEDRANAAEAELERLQMNGATPQIETPAGIVLAQAMTAFFRECEMMPFNPVDLQRDAGKVQYCLDQIRDWCRRMDEALAAPVITEARVV